MFSSTTFLLTFLTFLFLINAAAIPDTETSDLNHVLPSTNVTFGNSTFDGFRSNDYIHTGIKICVDSDVANECQFATYYRKDSPVGVELFLFNNRCVMIGFNGDVSTQAMRDWFGFNSQLPKVVIAFMEVNINTNGGPEEPYFWYDGTFYNPWGGVIDWSKNSIGIDDWGGVGSRMTFRC